MWLENNNISPIDYCLSDLLNYNFDQIVIPEMNNGQLIKIIRDKYLVPAQGLNKIKGLPFATEEVKAKIDELLNA